MGKNPFLSGSSSSDEIDNIHEASRQRIADLGAEVDALAAEAVKMTQPQAEQQPDPFKGGKSQGSTTAKSANLQSNNFAPPALAPLFEQAARKHKVPVNVLMAIGRQESSFDPTAEGVMTKWGTAKGLMQYLDSTAAGMGINPFDPAQAVDAAAKQIAERMAKGYSIEEAVAAHHAGDNREEWGDKTSQYVRDVLGRAADIKEQYLAKRGAGKAGAGKAPAKQSEAQKDPAAPQDGKQAGAGGESILDTIGGALQGIAGMLDNGVKKPGADARFGKRLEPAARRDLGVMGTGEVPEAPAAGMKLDRANAPVTPEAREGIKRAYEQATPAQREKMLAYPGWQGSVARKIHSEKQAIEQGAMLPRADGTPGLEKQAITRQERVAGYLSQGLDKAAAERSADADLRQLGGNAKLAESTFDFDGRKAWAESNTAVRAGARAGRGLMQAGYGTVEFLSDLAGAEDMARGAQLARKGHADAEAVIGQNKDAFMRPVEDAMTSIATQVPLLVGGAVSGSAAVPLAGMFVQTFGQEYGEAKDSGLPVDEAATRAAIMGAFEVIGETLPVRGALGAIKAAAKGIPLRSLPQFLAAGMRDSAKKAGISDFERNVLQMMAGEPAGELVTHAGQYTAGQLINASGRPNFSLDEYLSQAGETLKVAMIQSAMMGGGAVGAGMAINKANEPSEKNLARAMNRELRGAEFNATADEVARSAFDLPAIQIAAEKAASVGATPREIRTAIEAGRRERAGGVPAEPIAERVAPNLLAQHADKFQIPQQGGALTRALDATVQQAAEAAPAADVVDAPVTQPAEPVSQGAEPVTQTAAPDTQAPEPVSQKAEPASQKALTDTPATIKPGQRVTMTTPQGDRPVTVMSVQPGGSARVVDNAGEMFAIEPGSPFQIKGAPAAEAQKPAEAPAAEQKKPATKKAATVADVLPVESVKSTTPGAATPGAATPGAATPGAATPGAAPAPAAKAGKKKSPNDTMAAGDVVTVNSKDITLTQEQAEAWNAANASHKEAVAAVKSRPDNADNQRMLKGMAMKLAAKRRQITGALTAKEQAAAAEKAPKQSDAERITALQAEIREKMGDRADDILESAAMMAENAGGDDAAYLGALTAEYARAQKSQNAKPASMPEPAAQKPETAKPEPAAEIAAEAKEEPTKAPNKEGNSAAPVSSREGQMHLANRAGTIATLKMMNGQLQKIAPAEAWDDRAIEEATDLDYVRDSISTSLVEAQRAANGSPAVQPQAASKLESTQEQAAPKEEKPEAEKISASEAAAYLKDVLFSLNNIEGMTDGAQLELGTGALAKSGRDTLLMEAFGITRDDAHAINNGLDSRKSHKLRAIDMEEAFDIFPSLRGIIDKAIADDKARIERKASEKRAKSGTAAPADDGHKLVTTERYNELRARLKSKLNGSQLNSGIDPEILAIGTEMAVYHIEGGVRKFAEFARKMAEELDSDLQSLKPYLRSWYNGARDMAEDSGLDVSGMESPDEVRAEQAKLYAEPAQASTPDKPEPAPAKAESTAPAVDSTAPEHAAVGVDERELSEIVEQFNARQASMFEGGDQVTHVFDAPAKDEVVRLQDKVRVYHAEHGWMTPEEAKAKINEWREHAQAQGEDDAIRRENSKKIVLSLFDLSGAWSKPWAEAGYQVWQFDIQADAELGDINNFSTEFFADTFGDFDGQEIYAILAACPCTDFASSGSRHFAAKDKDGRTVASVKLVQQTLATIEYFKPAVWAVENPVGRIEKLGGLPPWRLSFDPNHVGEDYTKKTLIWGRFNGDLPIAPTEATEGSKMHRLYGGKSLKTKNARSVTPEGFAYSFFMANNAHDHPVMALANVYDRLDRELIAEALDAGVTADAIKEAVDDLYYMDLDDAGANDAIRALIEEQQGEVDGGDAPVAEAEPTQEPEAEKPTRKAPNVEQFLDGMKPNVRALAVKALEKQWRIDGEVMSAREIIERDYMAGTLELEVTQEPKIKDPSRTAFNRMDNRQQKEHAQRQKAAGMVNVYTVNDRLLGKYAYDYAAFLQSQPAAPDSTMQHDAAQHDAMPTSGKALALLRGTLTDEEIDGTTDKQLREALAYIRDDFYRGLTIPGKDIIRRLDRSGELDVDDARKVLRMHRDYWIKRGEDDAAADARFTVDMDRLHGAKSLGELADMAGMATARIASLQQAGAREMNGNGGRRTGAATSNEAARAEGEERMRIERYAREREEAARNDTPDASNDLSDYQVERVAKAFEKAPEVNGWKIRDMADSGVNVVHAASASKKQLVDFRHDGTPEGIAKAMRRATDWAHVQPAGTEAIIAESVEQAAQAAPEEAQPAPAASEPAPSAPTEATPAVHVEDGKAEKATAPVIAASIAKGDRNRGDMDRRQIAAEALRQIDQAIEEATLEDAKLPEWKEPTKEHIRKLIAGGSAKDALEARQLLESLHADARKKDAEAIGYVTIDIPGDGKFKVLRTKNRLREFRKKLVTTLGARDTVQAPRVSASGSDTPTMREFYNDGEMLNALELMRMKGARIIFGAPDGQYEKAPLLYMNVSPVDLGEKADGLSTFVGQLVGRQHQWAVLEEQTGTTIGHLASSKDEAIKTAKKRLLLVKPGELKENVGRFEKLFREKGKPFGQKELEDAFVAHYEAKEQADAEKAARKAEISAEVARREQQHQEPSAEQAAEVDPAPSTEPAPQDPPADAVEAIAAVHADRAPAVLQAEQPRSLGRPPYTHEAAAWVDTTMRKFGNGTYSESNYRRHIAGMRSSALQEANLDADDFERVIERAKAIQARERSTTMSMLKPRHVVEAMRELGLLTDSKPAEGSRQFRPPEARYAHPENAGLTWTGRGRKPLWVQEWIDNGGTLEQMEINKAEAAEPAAQAAQDPAPVELPPATNDRYRVQFGNRYRNENTYEVYVSELMQGMRSEPVRIVQYDDGSFRAALHNGNLTPQMEANARASVIRAVRQQARDALAKMRASSAYDSSDLDPVYREAGFGLPYELTPKQYHAERVQAAWDEYGKDYDGTRAEFDEGYPYAQYEAEWVREVRNAAKAGKQIPRQTLDRLADIGTPENNGYTQLIHDVPDAKIPEGYMPKWARDEHAQVKADRAADIKQGQAFAKDLNEATKAANNAIVSPDEFPTAEVDKSYSGISHQGGVRARRERDAFVDLVLTLHAEASAKAETPAQKEALDKALAEFKAGYITQTRKVANVRSGVVSSFVAGRSNFNSKQANKRGSALDKAEADAAEWVRTHKKDMLRAVRAARTPEQIADEEIKAGNLAAAQAAQKQERDDNFMRKVLSGQPFKIGSHEIVRVTKDRAGYPKNLVIKSGDGDGIIKGVNDKVELVGAKSAYPTAEDLRNHVDRIRAEMAEAAAGAMQAAVAEYQRKMEEKQTPIIELDGNRWYVVSTGTKRDGKTYTHLASVDQGDIAKTGFSPRQMADYIDDLILDGDKAAASTEAPKAPAGVVEAHDAVFYAAAFDEAVAVPTQAQMLEQFDRLVEQAEEVKAQLAKETKDQLAGRIRGHIFSGEKKDELVRRAYTDMLGFYGLMADSSPVMVTFGMGEEGRIAQIRKRIAESTDAMVVDAYAAQRARYMEHRDKVSAMLEGMKNPQTIADFRAIASQAHKQGKALVDVLTPEQLERADDLIATEAKAKAAADKAARREVREVDATTTASDVIEAKHTKHGYDLFVIQLVDRVERDKYDALNTEAKRLGGSYSSFRGRGAVPGFQFRKREAAEAFRDFVNGDSTKAKEVVAARRDAFEDDKQQSTVERLREMADALEASAESVMNADRKTNTARRAAQAASAEAHASGQKAFATTMRNIADGIAAGNVRWLDGLRTKTQLSTLLGIRARAVDAWVNANPRKEGERWENYEDRFRRVSEAPPADLWKHAAYPTYTLRRSDVRAFAKRLEGIEGFARTAAAWLRGSENVEHYHKAVQASPLTYLLQVSSGDTASLALFSSKAAAERVLIAHSRRTGIPRDEVADLVELGKKIDGKKWALVMPATKAEEKGIYDASGADTLMTLNADRVEALLDKVAGYNKSRARHNQIEAPYWFADVRVKRMRLQQMGINDANTLRMALRELETLKTEAAAPDRVKQLERALVGSKNIGVDFFPTPASVADDLVNKADIQPGMRILEPSAGNGNIADAIRRAGFDPNAVEQSSTLREILEAKGYNLVGNDFMELTVDANAPSVARDEIAALEEAARGDVLSSVRGALHFFDKGDIQGAALMLDRAARQAEFNEGRDSIKAVAEKAAASLQGGYDRIVMNPPFSNRLDAQHVRHAFDLLKPGGRLVAIMGEGVFFGQDKKAAEFREWLEELGGVSEQLPAGTFLDASLPTTTGVAARVVTINKPSGEDAGRYSFSFASERAPARDIDPVKLFEGALVRVRNIAARFGKVDVMRVVPTFSALPAAVQKHARDQGGDERNTKGVFVHDTGLIYIVADTHSSLRDVEETAFHELTGHYAFGAMMGNNDDARNESKRDLFKRIGGMPGLLRMARRFDIDRELLVYEKDLIALSKKKRIPQWVIDVVMLDELFAHIAERLPFMGFADKVRVAIKRILGTVRGWLRDRGFKYIPEELSDGEVVNLIHTARKQIEKGAVFVPDPKHPGGGGGGALLRKKGKGNGNQGESTVSTGRISSVSEGLSAVARFLLHPRHIAALRKSFTPVYETIEERTEARDQMVHHFYTKAAPYFDLPPESRSKVDAVLELGRLTGQVFEGSRVQNTDSPEAQLSMPGETIQLTKEERAAYTAIRETLDGMLDEFKARKVIPDMVKAATAFGRPDLVEHIVADKGNTLFVLEQEIAALHAKMADLRAQPETEATAAELSKLEAQQQGVAEIAMTLAELEQVKRTGYVPFSRYGDVVLTVKSKDADGKPYTVHTQTIELPMLERKKAALTRIIKAKRGEKDQGAGVMTDLPTVRAHIEELKRLFAGQDVAINVMDLEDMSVELSDLNMAEVNNLARVAGVNPEEWEKIRGQMADAIRAKGYRRHFFSSKLVPGYDTDFERSIANYILSFSGYMARDLYAEQLQDSVTAIKNGQVRDYAKRYVEYVDGKGGGEEFARWRAGIFLYYIAGVPASAVANMTQPFVMTLPALGQFVGLGRAAAAIARAAKDAASMFSAGAGLDQFDPDKAPADVRGALKKAWADGAFIPLTTHEAQGFAYNRSKAARGAGRKANEIIARVAYLFSLAERFNRLTTFIAAYRIGQGLKSTDIGKVLYGNQLAQSRIIDEHHKVDMERFAHFMVDDTQFRMGKINRPQAMRGIGAPLLQFKGFMMQSLEAWYRMVVHQDGARMALTSLAIVVALAGVWGIPFADDFRKWAEATHEAVTGERLDLKTRLRELVTNAIDESVLGEVVSGKHAALALDSGLPMAAGYDLRRLGMGNVLPDNDLYSLMGMPGDVVKRAVNFVGAMGKGDGWGAAAAVSPNFIKNPVQGAAWLQQGVKTQSGREVVPAREISIGDALLKSTGTTPVWISEERSRQYALQADQGAVDAIKRRFNNDLARVMADRVRATKAGDEEAKREALDKLAQIRGKIKEWNAGKPDYHQYSEATSKGTIKRLMLEELGINEGKKYRKKYRQRAEGLGDVFVTGKE